MWQEARRQEKKIRGLMVDYKKRAERRREYYEKIKLDPTQFLRIYGRPSKIHLETSVAIAAEGPQSMMPWQGNPNVMIDRFDVRATLDHISDTLSVPEPMTAAEDEENRKINYERYRILVQNECAGVGEEQCLQQIYLDEQFGAIDLHQGRLAAEEKKKLSKEKAAIGYTYEDSTPAAEMPQEVAEEEEEEEEQDILSDDEVDLDMALDVELLTEEQGQMLNSCATQYGMADSDYMDALYQDKEEEEALRLAKLLEEEKAQFSGRKSRRERRAYKERKLKGRQISPPSYAARESPKYEPVSRASSSSRSRSPSPVGADHVKFITSFGGESSDEEGSSAVVQGPSLPPQLQSAILTQASRPTEERKVPPGPEVKSPKKILRKRSRSSESSHSKSSALRSKSARTNSTSRSRSRSNSRTGNSYSKRSQSRSRSRSRSPRNDKRSNKSKSPSARRGRYRSHSRSRSYSRSRSRSRSKTRNYRRSRTRSRSSRSRSRSRSSRSRSHSRSRSYSRSYSSSRSRSRGRRSRTWSSSSSRSGSRSHSRSRSRSQQKQPPIKSYRRESLSSSSSMCLSEDEDPQTGDNNQSKKSESMFTPMGKASLSAKPRLTMQERLKRRMQAALNKQYKMDKRAEQEKISKIEQERLDREEELRALAIQMRKREREKRHREREELEDDWEEGDVKASEEDSKKDKRHRSHAENHESDEKKLPLSARKRSYRPRTQSGSRSWSRSPPPHKSKWSDSTPPRSSQRELPRGPRREPGRTQHRDHSQDFHHDPRRWDSHRGPPPRCEPPTRGDPHRMGHREPRMYDSHRETQHRDQYRDPLRGQHRSDQQHRGKWNQQRFRSTQGHRDSGRSRSPYNRSSSSDQRQRNNRPLVDY